MTGKPDARRRRSRETRVRLLEAALGLFVEHGYDGTTIEAIAREGEVAVQTVYFKFGTKVAILKEVLDVRVAGDDRPVPTVEREWFRAAIAARDPREQLRHQVAGAREIHERLGGVLEVLRNAAASNEEVAPLWERNKEQRLEVQTLLMGALADKHPLPTGLGVERAADIGYTLLGPEVHHLLVTERGWSAGEWADWVYADLCRHLLGES
ncbi:TetR/AcrR family transcriptional regulator [Streptomyces sp. ST2-7A]|uniref:TetR/AcrR family transcriptional regulator n=1 Tax=Streptomyces sp. ST2-7A TaxID=2907214 RepID=UPI001F398D36|nr:TetR/AcrR family transcriptional regulator [Streptomyces sp. ST2-7A]MCE7081800.1 TetR/AcrR family transcriptional regulator [Streptomyces sp. ST2-7A]